MKTNCKVTKITPNGERIESLYRNDLNNKENLITEIIEQVFHSGNILDEYLRNKANKMITKGKYYWMMTDANENVYMAKINQ